MDDVPYPRVHYTEDDQRAIRAIRAERSRPVIYGERELLLLLFFDTNRTFLFHSDHQAMCPFNRNERYPHIPLVISIPKQNVPKDISDVDLALLADSVRRSTTSIRAIVHSPVGQCYTSIIGQSPIGTPKQSLKEDYFMYSTISKPIWMDSVFRR